MPTQPDIGVHQVEAELCGRDQELKLLDDALERALQYRAPQLVTVSGAAGVGKSRLVKEWLAAVRRRADGARVFTASAPEQGGDYAIFGRLLRQRFGVHEGDSSDKAVETFRAQITEVFADRRVTEVGHFLGSFMGLKLRDNPFLKVMEQAPGQRDQIARAVLCRFLETDAARAPIVLVFENVQRADAKSLSLLKELSESLVAAPVVLVALARPELFVRVPGWAQGVADHVHLELKPLPALETERLLRSLLRKVESLPQDLVDHVVEMTGGNPLFAYQLVRALLARGTITVRGERWFIDAEKARTVQLPMSVEEAVAARIAALEPRERDLLEKAATLGSVFWTGALVVLSRLQREMGEEELQDDLRAGIDRILGQLVDRDYLLRMPDSTIANEEEYVFKHNLEREFVQKSTAPERARRYHLFGAQWLETRIAERTEENLEFLGNLYEAGGNQRRAAYYFVTAADRARARHANEIAARLYERGLGLLDFDDALSKIEALHNLGDVLLLAGKIQPALDRFADMLRYAWLLDHPAKAGAAHSRIGRIYRQTADYDKAAEHLRLAHQLFTRAGDRRGVAAALDDIGKLHFLRGDYGPVLDLMREALTLRRAIGDKRSIAVSLANIGRVHQSSGQFVAAIDCQREALELFRAAGDRTGEVGALEALGTIYVDLGEHGRAYDLFKEAHAQACDVGDRLSQAKLLAAMAEAQVALGQPKAAAEHVEQAAAIAHDLGDRRLLATCDRKLGEIHLALGEVVPAREHCDQALALAEKLGMKVEIAATQRATALILMHPSFGDKRLPEAERLLEEAIRLLMEAHDEPELARTYEALARLLETTGELARAQDLRKGAQAVVDRLKGAVRASARGLEVEVDLSGLD
jgi:tetratricopeptide (TPR) repeat protein